MLSYLAQTQLSDEIAAPPVRAKPMHRTGNPGLGAATALLQAPAPAAEDDRPALARGRTRVLCVEDHAILVEGLRARLAREPDFEYVGRLASADDLVASCERLRPDIVVMDIEMPGRNAFEAAADLRRVSPGMRVVFLSAHVRDRYLSSAMQSGAAGYFSKLDDPESLLDGLRRISRGESVLGPHAAERAGASGDGQRVSSRLDQLTDREREVLRLIGRGLTRAEIAESLCRSPKTIDGHRERILAKLDMHSGPELIRFAIREGLTEA